MNLSRRDVLGLTGAAVAGAVLSSGMSGARAAEPIQRVYLGTYTGSGGRGIGKGRIDEATGRLVVDSWFAGVPEPSWLDLAPDRKTLYAISETADGRIHALGLNAAGDPTLLNRQSTGNGPAHVSVHPSGKHLITSMYGAGSVAVHPILAGGKVGPASDVKVHPSTGAKPAHAHQIVVDPTGRWLLSVDLGLDLVYAYELNATTGRLTEVGQTRFKAGAGPRHLVFNPNRRYAYVANELDSTVTVCGWNAGRLVTGQVLSTLKTPSTVRNYPGEIAISPDGRFVYVSNRGHNSVAVFAVSDDGAALALVATPTCGGDWPRHLAIAPGGRWLYTANQRSGNIVWFPLDAATGLPGAEAGRLAVTAPANLLFA